MNSDSKTSRRGWRTGALALVVLGLGSASVFGRLLDRVAAVVNGETILYSEVERFCQSALDDVPATLPLEQTVQRRQEIRKQALDTLIDDLLVRQQIRQHKVTVADDEVEQEIKRVMESNKINEQQLVEALRMHEGKTIAEFKDERRRDMEQQKLIDLQIRSNPEIRGRLQVGEKDVEDAYLTQYQSVGSTEKVRASHILFNLPVTATPVEQAAVRARAEKVLEQLRAGGSFEELARANSDDPSSGQGGDLGFFRRGDMVAAFEQAAFGLKKGETSGLVQTQFGFHIIKATDRAAEGPPPLEKVRDEIRARLQRDRFQRVMREWIDDLRQRATISIKL